MLAHKLTDEAIRTDYEILFQRGLDSLDVIYVINSIYCFKCRKAFNWSKSEAPERCFRGGHKWTELGQFARPDFSLLDEDGDIKAVVRIDGPVHDKRRQIMKDRFQAQSFLDCGIKVFIIRNEWLLGAQHVIGKKIKKWMPIQLPDWIYRAYAYEVVMGCMYPEYYEQYLKDKDVRSYLGIKPQH